MNVQLDNGTCEAVRQGHERVLCKSSRQGDVNLLELCSDRTKKPEERYNISIGQIAVWGDGNVANRCTKAQRRPSEQCQAPRRIVGERQGGEIGEICTSKSCVYRS